MQTEAHELRCSSKFGLPGVSDLGEIQFECQRQLRMFRGRDVFFCQICLMFLLSESVVPSFVESRLSSDWSVNFSLVGITIEFLFCEETQSLVNCATFFPYWTSSSKNLYTNSLPHPRQE